MSPDALLVAGSCAGVVGVGLLRRAWGRTDRSLALKLAGWSLILGSAIGGWLAAGAWGTTVVALFPMLAAFAILAGAAFMSDEGKLRASNRRAGMLPEAGEPWRIAGRLLTFALVAVVAALLGIGIAVALGAIALRVGASEANAYALTLFFSPIAWTGIAFALLMQPGRRGQAKVLAVAIIPVWPTLAMGLLS